MNQIARSLLLYLGKQSTSNARVPLSELLSEMKCSESECMIVLAQLADAELVEYTSQLYEDYELETRITEKGQSVVSLLTSSGAPLVQVRVYPYKHLDCASYEIKIMPVPISWVELADKMTESIQSLLLQFQDKEPL